jgi:hypothetical protein
MSEMQCINCLLALHVWVWACIDKTMTECEDGRMTHVIIHTHIHSPPHSVHCTTTYAITDIHPSLHSALHDFRVLAPHHTITHSLPITTTPPHALPIVHHSTPSMHCSQCITPLTSSFASSLSQIVSINAIYHIVTSSPPHPCTADSASLHSLRASHLPFRRSCESTPSTTSRLLRFQR